ncbi:MAG TPA: NADH-quinone oxidoreductase subunit A [Candidatus Polarisedimenticolia bacterium]|nr:NADH-quinone oxidoreductase subunit A [Candidatus Polarisedimenticolia bacterium]
MSDHFFPILVQATIAVAMAGGMILLSWLLGRRASKRGHTDLTPYECGLPPFQDAQSNRFSVKFYLVAMLFILFDIEAAYLFPWATVFRQLGEPAFYEMAVFIGVLLLGYLYILRRGALDWD